MSEKTYGSASGTTQVYVVEARTTSGKITIIAGNALSPEWRRVNFAQSKIGVPNCTYHIISERYAPGLFTYEAALALAHWFLTIPAGERATILPMHPLCVQARIVKVELKYSYETKEVGVGEAISHFDMARAAKFEPR